MTIPSIFQVYTFNLNDMSAFGGASIIALIYNPTGSESFHYASGRLLGTVLGSTASYLCVQIANGRRWVLYIFIALLSLVGCYVQAAPGWYALGNAIACSTISVITQYKDLNAAMTRIQQNSFAILIYFAITSLIWPMRARKRVRMGLDVSLRCLRESCARLLRNLDMPLDASEVAADVSALLKEMNTKIISQHKYIAGAVEEPTMSSAEYPEEPMRQIVMAERRIWSTLSLMRFAYNSFMASDTEDTEISVHWVVLHRIAPHAQNLADLVYSLMDLYLLSLSKTTVVPTSHLARIRLAMIETENAIINTYIETIRRKVAGVDDDDDGSGHYDDDENDSYYSGASSSAPATITSGMSPRPHHGNDDDDDPPLKPPAKETKKEEGDTGSHGDEQTEPKKKKKTGYLGYQLTDDEKQALRNFIQGKVTNNSFNNTNNAMSNILSSNAPNLNNSFINNMSFGNTGTMFNNNNTFASRMSAALSGQSASAAPIIGNTPGATASSFGTTGDNTNRLMALAGNDTGLAAELRKKHGVVSKTEKVEKEMAEAAKKEEKEEKKKDKDDDDDMFNNTLSNASFLKNNSFLKNTSFIGALFKRKNKKQHDLDDEDMDDHHSKKTEEEEEDPSRSVSLSNRTHTPAPRPGTCTPDEGNRMEFSRRSDGSHRSFDEDERTPAKEKQDNEKALASTLKEPAKDEDDEKSGEKALEATVKGSNKEDDGEEEKSGDTTKKVVSPKTSTTDDEAKEAKKSGSSSPKKTEAHSDEDETLDKTTRQTDDKHSATTKSAHGGLTFGSVGDADEVLNNISFFDPDRGEFVLTNHDIHSLEAFLFGTRALVTYINDLQNAILDMQHSSELAKYL
ncbi:hypothetical protein AGDE_13882 [Angomonas deanei]|uniref:Fusaric acid resistance protein-like, putative n=1 Tax=Angomonas deanei TaxID=59799 RepID=A0A7G2CJJ7_9TRYP|nr:hypothetical protein AGDE_13882 [Angomonas deanei]CAD2219227.1 Fusaric acid resistance protein-like, putative [Angomonas deanei]|eukprot:EPY21672.1 hypothetical protein AGDE_13882 [Angomonas deanei]